jgi:hypothetical protein
MVKNASPETAGDCMKKFGIKSTPVHPPGSSETVGVPEMDQTPSSLQLLLFIRVLIVAGDWTRR